MEQAPLRSLREKRAGNIRSRTLPQCTQVQPALPPKPDPELCTRANGRLRIDPQMLRMERSLHRDLDRERNMTPP